MDNIYETKHLTIVEQIKDKILTVSTDDNNTSKNNHRG